MAAAVDEPRSNHAHAQAMDQEEAAVQPIIVLTDCASPYRVIGVSANWTDSFGTSTPELVGRGINLVFGPQTDAKAFTSVLKHANLSISTAITTYLYDKSGVAKRYTVFGKESDVISPPACELFLYNTEELKRALTHSAKLVVSREEPYHIKCESGSQLQMACVDIVGRPLLDLFSWIGLDVSRLKDLIDKVSAEDNTYRETLWGDIDVRVCATQTDKDSAGLILVELTKSDHRRCEVASKAALHAPALLRRFSNTERTLLSRSNSFSTLPTAVPERMHILLQEGSGFPQGEKSGLEHFVRLSVDGATIESRRQDDNAPLWNEMHSLPIRQLPATVRIEAIGVSERGSECVLGFKELRVAEKAAAGYSDDWLQLELEGMRRTRCRVRLAFSCVENHLKQIKNGLFPSGARKFSVKA